MFKYRNTGLGSEQDTCGMQCASNTSPDRGSILYSRSKNYVNIFIDLKSQKAFPGKILSRFL